MLQQTVTICGGTGLDSQDAELPGPALLPAVLNRFVTTKTTDYTADYNAD